MSFTWDWLFLHLIESGLTDYYQVNVCSNYHDFCLYRLGRDKGVVVGEVHIIVRTSKSCYRVTSYDFDLCTYASCRTAKEVCDYLIACFVPKDYELESAQKRMKELQARREERRAQMNYLKVGTTAGEREQKHRDKKKRRNKLGESPPK